MKHISDDKDRANSARRESPPHIHTHTPTHRHARPPEMTLDCALCLNSRQF